MNSSSQTYDFNIFEVAFKKRRPNLVIRFRFEGTVNAECAETFVLGFFHSI